MLPYPRRRDQNGWTDELRAFLRKKYYRFACPGWRAGTERAGRTTHCKCLDCQFDAVYAGVWNTPERLGPSGRFTSITPGIRTVDGHAWTGRTRAPWGAR
jgi:hypothetical protein